MRALREKNDITSASDWIFQTEISQAACWIIQANAANPPLSDDILYIAYLILQVCEYMYNNTSASVLPLDDGIYDQLLVVYKQYHPEYQVGASADKFIEQHDDEVTTVDGLKLLYHTVSDSVYDKCIYTKDIMDQHSPISAPMRPRLMYTLNRPAISKRLINAQQEYPELVGTLDKCKFVLNYDAQQAGVFDNPAVKIFERDYIQACLSQGVIHPQEIFTMIGELKNDGVCVDMKVRGSKVIGAYSRGDTGADIATDLTPIFSGLTFYNAKDVPDDIEFGIKFEAVITRRNLELLARIRGKEYRNGRNAIIGLLGSSDAYRFLDYITLIPISTSLPMDRLDELAFLNKYYNLGEYNRYLVFKGNYQEILYHVKQFTESAEAIRSVLPYMIDGVVISFYDRHKIQILGRVASVNKWQMAIKFNPRKVRTIFLGYSYNIGKSGEVIPMVHFKPVEFIGTIHQKQTIHSYQRYKELGLIPGMEIDIDYVNDVISYVTCPETAKNNHLRSGSLPEPFIDKCPYCGSTIVISESGKSAYCPNPMCHERQIMRMVALFDTLNFKNLAEATVRALDLTSLTKLASIKNFEDEVESKVGYAAAMALYHYKESLFGSIQDDYKIMAALSFDGMGEEKWKRIFREYTLDTLFHFDEFQLRSSLTAIHGIGLETANAVINGFQLYHDDVQTVLDNIQICNYKDLVARPKVAVTGTRDENVILTAMALGYDCSEKYGVTKDTALLIAADKNSTSGKIIKAKKYGIPIMSVDEFFKHHNVEISKF